MKKLPIICCLILFSVQFASAQKTDTSAAPSTPLTYDLYMHRYHRNNTTAWVLLTGGVAATAAGLLVAGDKLMSPTSSRGDALILTGLAVTLVSWPFFLIGHDNKKEARMLLKNENVSMVGRNNFNYPALSLKIQF